MVLAAGAFSVVQTLSASALPKLLELTDSLGVGIRAVLPDLSVTRPCCAIEVLELLSEPATALRIEQGPTCHGLVWRAVVVDQAGQVLLDLCACSQKDGREPIAWRVALGHLIASHPG